MTCHLINKAVMKQNWIEALNQHDQPLEKNAAFSSFTSNLLLLLLFILFRVAL